MANTFTLLDQEVLGLQDAIAATMRKSGYAPVNTGRLRKSIKTRPVVQTKAGIQAPIQYVAYGVFPDLGTKYQPAQRFTERAADLELAKQADALGEAAGYDVLNTLDLPSNVNINLDV